MRGPGGMWGPAPGLAGREAQEALRMLEESQGLLGTILLGVALQYRSLDIERCRLLEGGPCLPGPGPEEVQAAASLITLCALFGFQRQAEGIAAQTAQAGECPDMMDVKLGAASILVTLLRLSRLLGAARQEGGSLETTEDLVEMPDL